MGFIKVVKNKAYYKRYQVKYRRRRANKTDYKARVAMVNQDKNKYQTPKYRLVVRITNRDVICQIFSSSLTHDKCLFVAYSHELKRYGLTVGLTNYAAAYATGLLLARRVDSKLKLGYKGMTAIDGKEFHVKASKTDGAAPFKALLDVGLARTTTGARVFGALKGAVDGGLDVPHNVRRFPGSIKPEEGKKWEYDPKVHRKYIFGGHVAEYMRQLSEDPAAYKRQFSQFIKAGVTADKMEKLYQGTHAAIRREPNKKRADTERGYFQSKVAGAKPAEGAKSKNRSKMHKTQRFDRILQKLQAAGKTKVPQILA